MEFRGSAGKGNQPPKDSKNPLPSDTEAGKLKKTSKKRINAEVNDDSSSDETRPKKKGKGDVERKIEQSTAMREESRRIAGEQHKDSGSLEKNAAEIVETTGEALKKLASKIRSKTDISTQKIFDKTNQGRERLDRERLNYIIQHFPDDLLGNFQDTCIDMKYSTYRNKVFSNEKSAMLHLYQSNPSEKLRQTIHENFNLICNSPMQQDNRTGCIQVMNKFEGDIKALRQQLERPPEVINRIIEKIDRLNDILGLPSVELLRVRREDLSSPNHPRDRRLVPQDYIPPTANQLRNAFKTFKDKVKQMHEIKPQHPLFKEIITKLDKIEAEHETEGIRRLIDTQSTNLLGEE